MNASYPQPAGLVLEQRVYEDATKSARILGIVRKYSQAISIVTVQAVLGSEPKARVTRTVARTGPDAFSESASSPNRRPP